ncbi:uncharacterized protein LOC111881122 [Lactuca sativa]|uniref:uncharacterized protein LOC111881122 n=1 Tax=Lactuca sativa TaxID=4236 RepID=UPI0022B04677|nr:uncharacterized protein LOC111881122 [Lactuca sativa]
MLRRSILEISSRRSVGRISPRITTQIPLYLSSRKEFSTASQSNSPENPPNSGGNLSKVFIGSIALGVAGITAYQTGYFDKVLTKEQNNDLNTNPLPIVHEEPEKSVSEEQVAVENVKDSEILSPPVDNSEKGIETDPYYGKREEENQSEIEKLPILEPQDVISGQEGDLPISTSDSYDAIAKIQEDLGANSQDLKSTTEEHEEVQSSSILNEVAPVLEANEIKSEGILSNDNKEPDALLDEYLLKDKAEESAPVSSYPEKEIAEAVMGNNDIYVANDGKIVLDFLQAIHTAEKRQEDLDARIFSEEKRLLKEKYDKELKDARARELMYAERETILDKELHKEKVKAAAALKSLQEKLEEEFRMEIEKKESEAELEVMKLKDLAKAELAAAIASEKASQIEKMEEANLNINALCMAFYARSEEARQTHSVHKLALGALALEDALSKGLPIEKEIEALKSYIDGIDKDSLLGLVIASLPEDTLKNGTDTILQLNHKFDGLKGTLRHFSLMPPGGGGILAHSLAYIASVLKVKEADKSGDGIESVINRVESLLADGKLLEAAETLENGLKGSQATEVVGDWIHQARNRAITEQALTLLQSYATSASYT